jgi:hypothetical protein
MSRRGCPCCFDPWDSPLPPDWLPLPVPWSDDWLDQCWANCAQACHDDIGWGSGVTKPFAAPATTNCSCGSFEWTRQTFSAGGCGCEAIYADCVLRPAGTVCDCTRYWSFYAFLNNAFGSGKYTLTYGYDVSCPASLGAYELVSEDVLCEFTGPPTVPAHVQCYYECTDPVLCAGAGPCV